MPAKQSSCRAHDGRRSTISVVAIDISFGGLSKLTADASRAGEAKVPSSLGCLPN
jgi:hypothetical protein